MTGGKEVKVQTISKNNESTRGSESKVLCPRGTGGISAILARSYEKTGLGRGWDSETFPCRERRKKIERKMKKGKK